MHGGSSPFARWLRVVRFPVACAFVAAAAIAVPATAQSVTVLAAASLRDAMNAAAAAYEKDRGVKAVLSYAATSALARQVESGAPADVFVSADLRWMDHLEQQNLIVPGTRVRLLANRLVLIAPADRAVAISIGKRMPLVERLGGGRLAVADPDHVPAGRYAKAALEHLDIWNAVRPHLAPVANVRAALALVARGEAPLGIVYQTDARAERRVKEVGVFPVGSHPPILYPIAVLRGGRSPDAARALIAFMRGPQAAEIFRSHGFSVVE